MRKKVKLSDLNPNPYRDIGVYPFKRDKIDALKTSINDTGFWDNILAREYNGQIQIAYGHHRLNALQELYCEDIDFEVDIPVKDLSDAMMIKIMARENMEEWKTDPAIIDETVKLAKRFLENNPEELKKVRDVDGNGGAMGIAPVGYRIVAKFTGIPEGKVQLSLERLNLADEGMIDLKAVQLAKTNTSATINIPVYHQGYFQFHFYLWGADVEMQSLTYPMPQFAPQICL